MICRRKWNKSHSKFAVIGIWKVDANIFNMDWYDLHSNEFRSLIRTAKIRANEASPMFLTRSFHFFLSYSSNSSGIRLLSYIFDLKFRRTKTLSKVIKTWDLNVHQMDFFLLLNCCFFPSSFKACLIWHISTIRINDDRQKKWYKFANSTHFFFGMIEFWNCELGQFWVWVVDFIASDICRLNRFWLVFIGWILLVIVYCCKNWASSLNTV